VYIANRLYRQPWTLLKRVVKLKREVEDVETKSFLCPSATRFGSPEQALRLLDSTRMGKKPRLTAKEEKEEVSLFPPTHPNIPPQQLCVATKRGQRARGYTELELTKTCRRSHRATKRSKLVPTHLQLSDTPKPSQSRQTAIPNKTSASTISTELKHTSNYQSESISLTFQISLLRHKWDCSSNS